MTMATSEAILECPSLRRMTRLLQVMGLYAPRPTDTLSLLIPVHKNNKISFLLMVLINLFILSLLLNFAINDSRSDLSSMVNIAYWIWDWSPLVSITAARICFFGNQKSLHILFESLGAMSVKTMKSQRTYWKRNDILLIAFTLIIFYSSVVRIVYDAFNKNLAKGVYHEILVYLFFLISYHTVMVIICSFSLSLKIAARYILNSTDKIEEMVSENTEDIHVISNIVSEGLIRVQSGVNNSDGLVNLFETCTQLRPSDTFTVDMDETGDHLITDDIQFNRKLIDEIENVLIRTEKCLRLLMSCYSTSLLVVSVSLITDVMFGIFFLIESLAHKSVSHGIHLAMAVLLQSLIRLLLLHDSADDLVDAVSHPGGRGEGEGSGCFAPIGRYTRLKD